MDPVNNRSRFGPYAYRRPASPTNQSHEPLPPQSSHAQAGSSSSMPGLQEAQPTSQRVIPTVNRMAALGLSELDKICDGEILSLLGRYAAGEAMDVLKQTCPRIDRYLTWNGGLQETSTVKHFRERLNDQEYADVMTAIERRQNYFKTSHREPDDIKVLSLLDRYAAGESTKELSKTLPSMRHYLTNDGRLADKSTARNFFERLNEQERANVLKAIRRRQQKFKDHPPKASAPRASLAVEPPPVRLNTPAQAGSHSKEQDAMMTAIKSGQDSWYATADILSLLDRYAAGEPISELKKTLPGIANYLVQQGGLSKALGAERFFAGLNDQQRADVLKAIERRQQKLTGHPRKASAPRESLAVEPPPVRLNTPAQAGSHSGMPSSSRPDSLMPVALLGGHDLEWVKLNIQPSSFKKAIESLKLIRFVVDVEDAAEFADIPGESLKHLLQSATGNDGTSRFQLTALGENYVDQLLPADKENIMAIITERNGGKHGLQSHTVMQQSRPGATQGGSAGHKRPLSQFSAPPATRQRTNAGTSSAGANLGTETDAEIAEMINELRDDSVELVPEAGGEDEDAAAETSRAGTLHGRFAHPSQRD